MTEHCYVQPINRQHPNSGHKAECLQPFLMSYLMRDNSQEAVEWRQYLLKLLINLELTNNWSIVLTILGIEKEVP